MSVATASAVLRSRLTRTISRALPRLTAAIAQAQPTLPVPIIPIFTAASIAGSTAGVPPFAVRGAPANRSLLCHAGRLEQEPGPPLGLVDEEEVIIAEVGARYMPMEVLGLQVKRKHIGDQNIERAGNLRHGVGA